MMLIFFLLFSIIICFILLFICLCFLGSMLNNNFNKSTIFECGFIPSSSGRISFSLRFFLIVLLFLIFDMEIILFIPLSGMQDSVSFSFLSTLLIMMIFFLLLGLFYEWSQGVLNWV